MTFNLPLPLTSVSERGYAEHYKMYVGYVERFNELWDRLEHVRTKGTVTAIVEIESLKVDLTYALGSVKNHEIYFGTLGSEGDAPAGVWPRRSSGISGGAQLYGGSQAHGQRVARGGRGRCLTWITGTCLTTPAGPRTRCRCPMWRRFWALDLYGHAYFYDFGNNKTAYIDAAAGYRVGEGGGFV